MLLWLGMSVALAADVDNNGIDLRISKMPFRSVVSLLVEQSGMRVVMDPDIDPAVADMAISINCSNRSLEDILSEITRSVKLDFWRDADAYRIGKRPAAHTNPVVIDPLPNMVQTNVPPPATANNTVVVKPAGITNTRPYADVPSTVGREVERPAVIRQIDLKNCSSAEMEWMLSGGSRTELRDQRRKKVLTNRIRTLLDPRKPKQTPYSLGEDYSSPSLTQPWMQPSGNSARRSSSTDSYQFPPMGGGAAAGGALPAFPGAGGGLPAPAGGASAGGTSGGLSGLASGTGSGSGGLSAFIPDGIEEVVGLIGLNSILVKAKTEEDIDRLEQLIQFLDKPVKQVIVEVMFVEMNVEDAMSMGASWQFAGVPLSVISGQGGGEGSFQIHYIKGNLKAALSTAITNRRAKVVNAPRVIVQNESSASFHMTTSFPFIIINEEQDVFGKSFRSPEIDMQEFEQGIDVDYVIIHPDDSVTLEVTPVLESPGDAVPIPGSSGSGGVRGSSSAEVEAVVRVKNGETIMMGGFVSRNEGVGSSRTPLLSNLPVIGPLLFRATNRSTNNRETMVFITPIIVKEDETNFGFMNSLPPIF
jgi:type II secretory pathway component GspD/PulD (secretin)